MKIKLLLLLSLFSSICYSQPRSNDDFLFGYIRINIPYVIINNPMELTLIQGNLFSNTVYPDDRYSKSTINLDTTKKIVIPDLPLYYGGIPSYGYEIVGENESFKKVIGFVPGDRLTIQLPNKEGAGLKSIVQIEQFIYISYGGNPKIIIKCNNIDSTFLSKLKNKNSQFIAHYRWRRGDNHSSSLINIKIPSIVKSQVDSLSKIFFPENLKKDAPTFDKNSYEVQEPILEISPIKVKEKFTSKTFFVSVMSFGKGGRSSILSLLDSNGNFIKSIENDMYYKILGLTDVNGDESHEIIISFSDGYGGGVKILTLDINNQLKIPNIIVQDKIWNVFD